MILTGKMIIGAACAVVLAASARAVSSDDTGNPYQSIVDHNVFALRPAPRPEDLVPKTPPPPPVKVELNGIMTIFGKQQALLKAHLPARAPEPAKDESYILSPGERDGDIEVVSIDPVAGSVKIKNQDVEQELNLDKDSAKVTAAPAGAAPPIGMPPPGFTPPGGTGPGGTPMNSFRSIPRPMRLPGSADNQSNTGDSSPPPAYSGGGISVSGGGQSLASSAQATAQQSANAMSADEQALMIEAQRRKFQQDGNPMATIMPPLPPAMQQRLGMTPPPTPQPNPALQ